eukprot:5842316-Pleurochrysis_carterae.AAC.1
MRVLQPSSGCGSPAIGPRRGSVQSRRGVHESRGCRACKGRSQGAGALACERSRRRSGRHDSVRAVCRENRGALASSHDAERRERRRRCRRLSMRVPCAWLRDCRACRCECAPPRATNESLGVRRRKASVGRPSRLALRRAEKAFAVAGLIVCVAPCFLERGADAFNIGCVASLAVV